MAALRDPELNAIELHLDPVQCHIEYVDLKAGSFRLSQ